MEEETTIEEPEIPDKDEKSEKDVKAVTLSPLKPVQAQSGGKGDSNIEMLLDIQVPIIVELGKTEMIMREVLALTPGAIIELDTLAGEPVKITIRGKTIAQGEVVVVDENFGVKITKIAKPQDRIKSAG